MPLLARAAAVSAMITTDFAAVNSFWNLNSNFKIDLIFFSLFIAGGRPDEAAAELVVGDADPGPDPPADAQPPPRRDDATQRTKVWN